MTALLGFSDCQSVSECFSCLCWRRVGSLVRVGSELWGRRGLEHPGSGPACSPFRNSLCNFGHASNILRCEILSRMFAGLFFSFFFFFLLFLPARPPPLSEGLHHLPAFHSLGSRGKELHKSTCCFYQVNLCEVAGQKKFIFLLSKPSLKNASPLFFFEGFFIQGFPNHFIRTCDKLGLCFQQCARLLTPFLRLRWSNS